MVRFVTKLLLLTLIATARSKPPSGDDLEGSVGGGEEEYRGIQRNTKEEQTATEEEEEEEEYGEEVPEVSPSFSSSGQDFKVEVGGDITFPCQVENKGAFLLMFKRVLADGEHRMLFVGEMNLKPSKRLNKSGDSFILQGVKRSHAGTYVCRIESSPAIEVTHTLDVQYPATVRRVSPAVQRVTHGASVTLECLADGNPPAAISWSRLKGRLPSGAQAEEGQSLSLEQVDRHVEGTYVCTASNGVGKPSSSTLILHVTYPPEVSTKQALYHLAEGDRAQLACTVHGYPAPTVTWGREGRPVVPSLRVAPHTSLPTHTLVIEPVMEEDFGDYTCSANNSLGTGEAALRLSGLPQAPRVTSSPAGGEEASYTLTWQAHSPSPITMYRLHYRPKQPFSDQWKVRLLSAHSTTPPPTPTTALSALSPLYHMGHALKDLQPATDYEATVAVENKYGWSAKSEVFGFYTRKEVAVGRSASGGAGPFLSPPLLPLTLLLATSGLA